MTDDRRDGVGQPQYGGPDPFDYERRAMQQRPAPNLSGHQALVRLYEQSGIWLAGVGHEPGYPDDDPG